MRTLGIPTVVDLELERRSLAFCRYADDCNVCVRSRVAGERVMQGIRACLEGVLRQRVNEAKNSVARPWDRTFLGYRVTVQRRLVDVHRRLQCVR